MDRKIKPLGMTYRKFKADYLFDGTKLLGPDTVLITNDEGIVQDVVPDAAAGEDVACYPGLLSPGFVNCHCHLELSHLKGVIPEGTGLVDFLSMVIWQRAADPDRVLDGIAAGEEEMLGNGIVAVGDICNTTDSLGGKKAGRLAYHNFVETIGFIDMMAAERFAASLEVYKAFENRFPRTNSIVPHAPYSVSPALLHMSADFPGNRLLSIHCQESEVENEFLKTGKGDLLRL